MKNLHRKLFTVVLSLIVILAVPLSTLAAPYYSYIYCSDNETALAAPAAVLPEKIFSGIRLGIQSFRTPADIAYSDKGYLYILDSGNGRVVCVQPDTNAVVFVLQGEDKADFTGAQGLFITDDGELYICDTDHARILKYPCLEGTLYPDKNRVQQIPAPDLSAVKENFVYKPTEVVVDEIGNLLVISEGLYEGLIEMTQQGEYLGFIGANKVNINYLELFWRFISTKVQQESSYQFIPVEFGSMDMDDEGFILATARGVTGNAEMVRRLNLSGKNILQNNTGYTLGDRSALIDYGTEQGETFFTDVSVGPYECFAALDITRGRIFVYDADCQLLFTFGGFGFREGLFTNPAALVWDKDNQRFFVLDQSTGEVTVFTLTLYGQQILKAKGCEFTGDFAGMYEAYNRILEMNGNSEMAYMGVGKAKMENGSYREAMNYFRLGNDKENYSIAYEHVRQDSMNVVIPLIILVVLAITLIWIIRGLARGIRRATVRISEIKRMGNIIKKKGGK